MNTLAKIFIIVFAPSLVKASTALSLLAGSYFENNTFYTKDDASMDGVFRVAPRVEHESDNGTLGLNANAGASYNQHAKFANQSYYDYDGLMKVPILSDRKWSGYIGGDYKLVSEPAATHEKVRTAESSTLKEQTRINRNVMGGVMGTTYKWTTLSTIRLDSRYQMEAYEDTYHKYMDNYYVEGSAYYDYQFLPETTFFMGGMMGVQQYPNGRKNNSKCNGDASTSVRPSECKNNSQYIEARSGIRGRLAERTRIDASAALQVREYDKSSSFSEPVFNLRVEEQFSPKDLLIAGYDYNVSDSKWTNFVIDQSTYLAYARILGDQLLLLGRASYTYSSYSKPFKREDQRLAANFKIDYSIGSKTKISGLLDIDLLNSDQTNTQPNNYQPDKPVGYNYIRTGIEFIQYF